MRIDLKYAMNEGMDNLKIWRHRYSKEDYPIKVVQNIFYRQYTMNSIWNSQLLNSFIKFKNTEKDVSNAYMQLEIEYSNASKNFAGGTILVDLMNKQIDIGGINYKNSIALIIESQKGDNNSIEELEFRYIFRLLSNKAVLMWAAFGRTGSNQSESIAQILSIKINPQQPILYSSILDLFGQSGVSQLMNSIYLPLPNLY